MLVKVADTISISIKLFEIFKLKGEMDKSSKKKRVAFLVECFLLVKDMILSSEVYLEQF